MVTPLRSALALGALALAGCYDMGKLDPAAADPGILVVDDFEDGDEIPNLPAFKYWKVYTFKKGPGATERMDLEQNPNTGYSLFGEFVFSSPGGGDFTGASLGIADADRVLDVRRFRALYVTALFDPGSNQLPTNTRVYAELQCNSVDPIPNQAAPYYVQHNIPVTRDWQRFPIDLDRFVEPSPEEPRITGGPPACLARIDAIRFTVSMSLDLGTRSGGKLSIDDVTFE